jgi:hypothetical protein
MNDSAQLVPRYEALFQVSDCLRVSWYVLVPAAVRIVGGFTLLTGVLLAIGFRTRLAGFLVASGVAYFSLSGISPTRNLFDRLLPSLFAETMSMAVVFLGPGAYLYGRKEIIIPDDSPE